MEKKSITSNRGTVYYWISDTRKAQCIMFTHGVTGDHSLFNRQIEFWSREFTLIVWDMPLHGDSRPYKDFTYANLAEDMKAILDQEKILHAVMAGLSAGGFPAQEFYRKYPEMVDAFIGIDTTPFGSRYYKKSELFWAIHYRDIAKWYPYRLYCSLAAKSVSRMQEARQTLYDCLVKLGKKGMLESADAVYKDFPNYEEVIFKCPVLLLLGEFDKTGYVKRYNEMWSKETGYRLIIIPGASHLSNYDKYNKFNEIVYDFLEENIYRQCIATAKS